MGRGSVLRWLCAMVAVAISLPVNGSQGSVDAHPGATGLKRLRSAVPVITSIAPPDIQAGDAGSRVILGASFAANSTVTLGGVALTVLTWTTTSLLVVIPANTFTTTGVLPMAVTTPGEGADSAPFTITPDDLDRIEVGPINNPSDPLPPEVAVQDTAIYGVLGFDRFGNPRASTPVTWQALAGGTLASSSTFSATLLAGTAAGTFPSAISARSTINPNIVGSAGLIVRPGPLVRLSLTPANATIPPNGAQKFTVLGFDSFSNTITATGAVWMANPAAGVIDGAGQFTATGAVGTYVNAVTATRGSITASASATLIPTPIASIIVTPSVTSLALRTTQMFTATAYDAQGHPIDGVTFSWGNGTGSTNSALAAGDIESSGPFTALLRAGLVLGTYPDGFSARAGNITAFANVIVLAPSVQIGTTPGLLRTDGNTAASVSVTITSAGGPVGPGVPVSITVTPSAGTCTLDAQDAVTASGGVLTATLRCVNTSPVNTLSSSITLGASLPVPPFPSASTILAGRFTPYRISMPLLMRDWPVTDNHIACAATTIPVPGEIGQRSDNANNLYRFTAPATGAVGISLRSYASSGTLYLYRRGADSCPITVNLNQPPVDVIALTPGNWSQRYTLTPNGQYILWISTSLNTLSSQVYTLRLEP